MRRLNVDRRTQKWHGPRVFDVGFIGLLVMIALLVVLAFAAPGG